VKTTTKTKLHTVIYELQEFTAAAMEADCISYFKEAEKFMDGSIRT